MILKTHAKHYLSGHETAYRAAAILYENALYPRHIWHSGLTRTALGVSRRRRPAAAQVTLRWPLEADCRDAGELTAWFRRHGVTFVEGGHAIYVPPQPALAAWLPAVVRFYPKGSGFKVLKDFRDPAHARYLYKHRHTLRVLSRLIGSPADQVFAANYLYAAGLGARLWDLAEWHLPDARCTVFVVEHIEGTVPDDQQCGAFLARLRELHRRSPLRVLIPHWDENADFASPGCSGNLIYSPAHGRAIYIDFQNFGLTDYTAWSAEAPDDCAPALLRDLAAGAAWAAGCCAADRLPAVERVLLSAGATRFTLLPSDEG